MMNANELKRLFPNASASTLARNIDPACQTPDPYDTGGLPASPESERPLRHEPVAAAEGKSGHTSCRVVRITSFGCRLLYPDNLVGGVKYFVDSIRYAGLIPGDAPENITLEVRQEKVKTRAEERTTILIL